ncbi:endonuclease [Neptunitalea sp. Y10]|uniref:Endonuclease n=2 Tax=Neptunitalea lumnitzerae TaxID=2965509 RepID=A0ABQ5MHQ5_9FLAO|nr:endonuclease [Neptunitalea sp. Y10]
MLNASNEQPVMWGATGHRVTGEVAADYIKKSTARKIEKLLDGHGLAEVSTFGDDIKSDKRFRKFGAWHYVNIDPGKEYGDEPASAYGDIIKGIDTCMVVLKSETATKADKQFYLKMLVHLVGDLHQPLHVGKAEDLGGNKIKVTWFREDSNLHRVWDSEMLDHYNMSYTEISGNFPELTKNQVKQLQKGSVLDWVNETRKLVDKVYASAKDGDDLGYRYMYDHFGEVQEQLEKGGVRLAKLLDEAFK